MAKGKKAFQRFLELVLDTDSAKKLERDTQRALKKGTDPKAPVEQLTHIERGLNRLKIAAVGVGVAIVGGLALGLRKMVRESTEAQAATAQLESVIRSTGGAAGRSVAQLEERANALQRMTAFSDDAVKGAQGLLLTFTQIKGAVLDDATGAVLDMATAMAAGTGDVPDLKSAALLVGKALQDPVKGMTALTRAGVSFSQAQKDVVAQLVETGDLVGAQTLILRELETQFGGSAVAARDTLGGALAGLTNAWGELFEVSRDGASGIIGAINSIADALPGLRDRLDSAAGAMQRFWDGTRRIREGNMRRFGRDEAADALLLDVLAGETDIGVAGPPRKALVPPIGPTDPATLAARAAAAAAVAAAEATRTVAAMVGRLTGGTVATPATPGLGGVGIPLFDLTAQSDTSVQFQEVVDFYRGGMSQIEDAGQTAALGIQSAFQDAFSALGDEGNAFGNFFEAIFRGAASSALTALAQLASAKVVENVARAFENIAAASASAAVGNLAGAALHSAAAKGFGVAALKWGLVGGAAGAAAAAVGGGGSSTFRGSDVVGRQIDKLDRAGPDIVIRIDGVDPRNPRHQALIGETSRQYQERYGGRVRLE